MNSPRWAAWPGQRLGSEVDRTDSAASLQVLLAKTLQANVHKLKFLIFKMRVGKMGDAYFTALLWGLQMIVSGRIYRRNVSQLSV